jgi:hypothetical protein
VRACNADEVKASQEEGVTLKKHQISATKVVTLATPSVDKSPPIFSRILEKLLNERAQVRKLMKTVTDKGQLNVLDCRQVSDYIIIREFITRDSHLPFSLFPFCTRKQRK